MKKIILSAAPTVEDRAKINSVAVNKSGHSLRELDIRRIHKSIYFAFTHLRTIIAVMFLRIRQ